MKTKKKIMHVGSKVIHTFKFIEYTSKYYDTVYVSNADYRPVPIGLQNSVKCFEINFSLSMTNLLFTTIRLYKIIKNEKPDIIHVHQANSYAFYTVLANLGIGLPILLSVWGSDILIVPKKNFLLKKMIQFNLKHVDLITSSSLHVDYKIHDLQPESLGKTKVLNFGIPDDFFINSVDLQRNKENIIFSNRMHKKLYRIDAIVNAFAKFASHHKDWRLVIAGSGEETPKLRELVCMLGIQEKVEFLGFIQREELKRWYSKSKIFISVPTSDASSASLLEAMALGCFPVVSYLPANLEWIIDGYNGLVVTRMSNLELTLVKAVEIVGSHEISNIIILNRDIILKKAKESEKMNEFLDIYRDLI
jgi:glycosyltransferase involved in cell wall biosynthesis